MIFAFSPAEAFFVVFVARFRHKLSSAKIRYSLLCNQRTLCEANRMKNRSGQQIIIRRPEVELPAWEGPRAKPAQRCYKEPHWKHSHSSWLKNTQCLLCEDETLLASFWRYWVLQVSPPPIEMLAVSQRRDRLSGSGQQKILKYTHTLLYRMINNY